MMKYGDRVRAARHKRGYTILELEDLSGVNHATIGNMEHGRYMAQLGTALCIADALDVSLDWLTGRTADPYAHKRSKGLKTSCK